MQLHPRDSLRDMVPRRLVSLQKKAVLLLYSYVLYVRLPISFPNTMAEKSCRLLEGKEASDFVASMDAFIFDCDGQ